MATESARCAHCARLVPWVSVWGNLALAVYKLAVGLLGRSTALVADAMHSFADVIGSSAIVVTTKVSSREPDETYPYGRGKAEFIGAVFVYTVLLFFAGAIIWGAISAMLDGDLRAPHVVTLLGGVVSVFHNLIMFRFLSCVGKRNNSPAILADAFENRADAVSSIACIAGILGALLIHPICDAIAALLVGVVIFWNCQEQLREAASGLMDRGMAVDGVEALRRAVLHHDRVQDVAFLRTRQTGSRYWVDIGVVVAPDLPVSEVDRITVSLREELMSSAECHYAQVFVVPASPVDEAAPVPG